MKTKDKPSAHVLWRVEPNGNVLELFRNGRYVLEINPDSHAALTARVTELEKILGAIQRVAHDAGYLWIEDQARQALAGKE